MPRENAIELNLSQLAGSDKGLKELQSLDPRHMGENVARPYEYEQGANSIPYDQFGGELRSEAIDQINKDIDRCSDSKIVVNGTVLNLKNQVVDYLQYKQENVAKTLPTKEKLPEKDSPEADRTFNYETVKSYLTEVHKLSDHQSNFILTSFHQAALSGSANPLDALYNNTKNKMNGAENSSNFVVEVNADQLSMSSCKNIPYIDQAEMEKTLEVMTNRKEITAANFIKDNAGLVTTPDSIIANFRVELGDVRGVTEPQTILQLCARGDCCEVVDKIKAAQKSARLSCLEVEPEGVKKYLDKFQQTILGKEKCAEEKGRILSDLERYQQNPNTSFECKLMDVVFSSSYKLQKAEGLLGDKNVRQGLTGVLAEDFRDYYPNASKGEIAKLSGKIVNDFTKDRGIDVERSFFSTLTSPFKRQTTPLTQESQHSRVSVESSPNGGKKIKFASDEIDVEELKSIIQGINNSQKKSARPLPPPKSKGWFKS